MPAVEALVACYGVGVVIRRYDESTMPANLAIAAACAALLLFFLWWGIEVVAGRVYARLQRSGRGATRLAKLCDRLREKEESPPS